MDLTEARSEWDAFRHLPFPRGWAGFHVTERALALTDTEAAGCIDTFFGHSQQRLPWLDRKRRRILVSLLPELDAAVAALEGEPREYFAQLRDIARFVVAASAP